MQQKAASQATQKTIKQVCKHRIRKSINVSSVLSYPLIVCLLRFEEIRNVHFVDCVDWTEATICIYFLTCCLPFVCSDDDTHSCWFCLVRYFTDCSISTWCIFVVLLFLRSVCLVDNVNTFIDFWLNCQSIIDESLYFLFIPSYRSVDFDHTMI